MLSQVSHKLSRQYLKTPLVLNKNVAKFLIKFIFCNYILKNKAYFIVIHIRNNNVIIFHNNCSIYLDRGTNYKNILVSHLLQ